MDQRRHECYMDQLILRNTQNINLTFYTYLYMIYTFTLQYIQYNIT